MVEIKYQPYNLFKSLAEGYITVQRYLKEMADMKYFYRVLEERLRPSDVQNLKYILAESFTG